MSAHRTITMADGKRKYQRYIGTDPTLRDSEQPHVWETVEVDAEGQPYAYRTSSGDCSAGVTAEGAVLATCAGVKFAMSVAEARQWAKAIEQAAKDAEAKHGGAQP